MTGGAGLAGGSQHLSQPGSLAVVTRMRWAQGRGLRHDDGMTRALRVLVGSAQQEAGLRAEVARALGSDGSWERFIELSHGSRTEGADYGGPPEVFDVLVTWGEAQTAASRVYGLNSAIETADCLASAL